MVNFIDRVASTGNRAVLVHLDMPGMDFDSDHVEFLDLARSAGATVLGEIEGSRRVPDAGFFVGSGKAQEVADMVAATGADVALFNHDLSPAQERNLEKLVKARVVGRTGLILDIFARRARSHEGKLQVELAQLEHMATRLVRGWTHLDGQGGGGIGMRGPGETQLETDRRLVRERIAHLKRQIETVRGHRELGRKARQRNDTPVVSIVGYTNAGKSTLFNRMTGDDTYAADVLFATLDTTIRRLSLPADQEILLADTVGFVRDLPHQLVAAFAATLEEARDASLLLHVVDAADPEHETRINQVKAVLAGIGADTVPVLMVYNKIDLREGETARVETDDAGRPERVFLSARTGDGLEILRQAIAARVYPDVAELDLTLPPEAGRLRARLYAHHAVQAETAGEDGQVNLRLRLPRARLLRLLREAGLPVPPGLAGPADAEDGVEDGQGEPTPAAVQSNA